MANPNNVIPYGELVHEAAVHGGPDNFLKEYGVALLEDAYPSFFNEGYGAGSSDGFKKGVAVTGGVATGLFLIWQAVDKLPKLYRYIKDKNKVNSDASSDKKIIERLLHLDEYVKDVAEATNEVVAYNVKGRVVSRKINTGNSTYESDIIFMNNGNYKFSTSVENDSITEYVASAVEDLLKDKLRWERGLKKSELGI